MKPPNLVSRIIEKRLREGAIPAELVALGYSRSTVYQVRARLTDLPLPLTAKGATNRTPPHLIAEARRLRAPPHSLSLEEIADRVGISTRTVHNAVRDLPIPQTTQPRFANTWTREQDQYLRAHYRRAERSTLVAALGHPWNSIANRASRFRLTRDRVITPLQPIQAPPATLTAVPPNLTAAPLNPAAAAPGPVPSRGALFKKPAPLPAEKRDCETEAIAAFLSAHGVTRCPPVGDPAIFDLPPLRWDPKVRRGTRRPL